MERYEIEAFLVLAEELHFGRAAEQLRLSTGRMSQIITKLERRIGARLFDRTSRRVSLTRIGARFQEDLRPGYEQVQQALERAMMAARGFDGPLNIGFLGAAGGQFLLEVIRAFRAEHPTTEAVLQELQMNTAITGLRCQDVDLVLIPRPFTDPDLHIGPALWAEPRYLAVSSRHPLASRPDISLEDLADVTLLRMPENCPPSIAEDRVPSRTPGGRPIAHGRHTTTFMEVLALVGAGEGAFTVGAEVNHFYVRPDITYLRMVDAPPVVWGLIWRRSSATARIRAFNDKAVELSRGRRTP
ncbi:LysR family transcriptional regulator [Streptomyces qinzhouensis]|uniref:LysR substrate-binding domain-containing protein n=1 Tax=Streptomyces qinzhouensis TaxID=2599401 RepID=UPI001FE8E13B|nr:LysR family transcriptional regulator [Streptomyces qinzhouensis]